mgnify:CR=1 FL=1
MNVYESLFLILNNLKSFKPINSLAITGTNGKTSVAFITKEIWRNCNVKSATIGTLGLITDGYKKKLHLTTENSVEIHKMLSILHKKKN